MGVRRLRPLSGIAVTLAATAALAGCAARNAAENAPAASSSGQSSPAAATTGTSAAGSSTSATSAAPSTPAKAPRTEKWTALEVGDCLADAPPSDPAVVEITVVDCSQPHLAETFLRAPIPVDAALDGTANAQCETAFAQYTGVASAASPYMIGYLIDSDQDRTFNNPLPSTVICLLQGAQGQSLTGSAAQG